MPLDADLVFDVRFLPNPHFVPEFRNLTGKDPKVENYIIGFPQTREFLDRVTELLLFLLPHYITEGKSYLTIAFGCTGGQHRSVMIAEATAPRPLIATCPTKRGAESSCHLAACCETDSTLPSGSLNHATLSPLGNVQTPCAS